MSVIPGLTRLLASRRLEGLRVGLVCNPASVDARLAHAADLVFEAPGVTLAALFGPQHGFRTPDLGEVPFGRASKEWMHGVPWVAAAAGGLSLGLYYLNQRRAKVEQQEGKEG